MLISKTDRAFWSRRRDAPDASGRLASFSIEGRGSRALPQSSWGVHSLLQAVHVRGRQFNSRQSSGLNKLAIKLSGSVDAGFILALPFHHWDLEPDCVGVLTRGGAYTRDKNTSARLCAKNAGGAYARGGAYLRDTTVYTIILYLVNRCMDHTRLGLYGYF